MSRQYRGRQNRGKKNFQSAAWSAAKFTGRAAEKTAEGIGRWVVTDHTGFGKALDRIPSSLGFFEKIKYVIMFFLINVVGLIVGYALLFTFLYFFVPYFIFGHF